MAQTGTSFSTTSSSSAPGKRCRAEMDSLPVSMVPLKKRAWKPNDNQIDLNIRSPTSIFTRNEGLELLGRTIFSRENGLSEVHLDLESPKNGGLESIPAFSSPVESNGDCDKLR